MIHNDISHSASLTESLEVKKYTCHSCFGVKPNWLSVVAKSGEMQDKI